MVYFNSNFFDRLTPAILTLLIALFLLRQKQSSARFLGFFFLFMSVFNAGYLWGYSVLSPLGAYGFYAACFITFALIFKIQFAYRMPRQLFPREAAVVFVISTLVSLVAVAEYFYTASKAGFQIFYDNHLIGSRYASPYIPLVSMIEFFWVAVVQLRYLYRLGWRSPEARVVWSFFILVLFELAINVTVLLGFVTDFVSAETVTALLSVGIMFVWFFYGLIYANFSRETTSLMLRIVGISLVTLLVAASLIGRRSLQRFELEFDRALRAPLPGIALKFQKSTTGDLPPEILYVAERPIPGGAFSSSYHLLYEQGDGFTGPALAESDQADFEFLSEKRAGRIAKERPGVTKEEAMRLAVEEFTQASVTPLKRRYRTVSGRFLIHYDVVQADRILEFGYDYMMYRRELHDAVIENVVIIGFVTALLLIVFPFFFRANLVSPMNELLAGVRRVDAGDLNEPVPVKIADEVGILAGSFNGMMGSIRQARRSLQEYAENLELRVKERTSELQLAYDRVEALKKQQDGDYFLTSLLIAPLSRNEVQSNVVHVEFLVRQKKTFHFKRWDSEIGGDICIADRVFLEGRPYSIVLNADAMGKSIQGGGGAIVLGSLFRAIVNRTHMLESFGAYSPERWMANAFTELDSVFKSFEGSMLCSLCLVAVDEQSGVMYFLCAEHPYPVLYRDGSASYLDYPHTLNKLGTPDGRTDPTSAVFLLRPGDVVILGSDGRDDILISTGDSPPAMNTDDAFFLRAVEAGNGLLPEVHGRLSTAGDITDDLSLARLEFDGAARSDADQTQAALRQAVAEMNWEVAANLADDLVRARPENTEFLFTASRISRKAGRYSRAIDLAERVRLRRPGDIENLWSLSRLYVREKKNDRAKKFLENIIQINPGYEKAGQLLARLNRKDSV